MTRREYPVPARLDLAASDSMRFIPSALPTLGRDSDSRPGAIGHLLPWLSIDGGRCRWCAQIFATRPSGSLADYRSGQVDDAEHPAYDIGAAGKQEAQRTRRKPCSRDPHLSYSSNSRCTYPGKSVPCQMRLERAIVFLDGASGRWRLQNTRGVDDKCFSFFTEPFSMGGSHGGASAHRHHLVILAVPLVACPENEPGATLSTRYTIL